jgi:PKD repeat protein
VDFIVNVTLGKAPLSVQFTDTSSEEDPGYFWDFGDGNVSSEADPMHTYAEPNRYTVLHRINNSANVTFWDNRTEYIRVYAFEPEVDFSADPTHGYTPLTVRFTDVSPIEEIISRKWDFGDGYTGTGQSVTHIYRNVGEYSVTLNVSTDNDTFSALKRDFISVTDPPKTTTSVKKQTTLAATRTKTPVPTTPPASKLIIIQYALDLSGFELSTLNDGIMQVTLDRGVLASKGIALRDQEDQLTLSYPTYELLLQFSNRTEKDDTLLGGLVSLRMTVPPSQRHFRKAPSLPNLMLSFFRLLVIPGSMDPSSLLPLHRFRPDSRRLPNQTT